MNFLQLLTLLRRAAMTMVAVSISLVAGGIRISAQAAKNAPGSEPVVHLKAVSTLTDSYSGPEDAVQALRSGQATPLSLVACDVDGDGVTDLIVGNGVPGGGGILTVHRGNLEAFVPQSEETFKYMAAGKFQDSILPGASAFPTKVRPDFLAAGNFYQSGHIGVVVAARGGNTINVLTGNGYGVFTVAQSLSLPGGAAVTALGAGKIGAIGQPDSVLIGVQGPQQPLLLLYRSSAAGMVLVNTYALPAPAMAFAFGDLDGHLVPDAAAVIAGGQLLMLHSGRPEASPALAPISLPFSVSAMALGSFAFDRNRRLQMALLSPDGALHIMAPNGFKGDPWTPEELETLRQVRLGKSPSPFHPTSNNHQEEWKEVESFSGLAPFDSAGRLPLLLRTRSGGGGGDVITVFNRDADQTAVISHPYARHGVAEFARGQTVVRTGSTRAIVAAVPMRLNVGATSGVLAISGGK